jgi:hypothetical protein
MKKISVVLLSLFAFLVISCENEPIDPALQVNNSSSNNVNAAIYKWKCKIDGVLYEWEGNHLTNPGGPLGAGGQATYAAGTLALQKVNSASAGISITAQMPNNTTGNFVFNSSQPFNIGITNGNPQNPQGNFLYSTQIAGTMNMNISSISNNSFVNNPQNPGKVIGTFSGTIGTASLSTGQITTSVVTDGSFEALRAQ